MYITALASVHTARRDYVSSCSSRLDCSKSMSPLMEHAGLLHLCLAMLNDHLHVQVGTKSADLIKWECYFSVSEPCQPQGLWIKSFWDLKCLPRHHSGIICRAIMKGLLLVLAHLYSFSWQHRKQLPQEGHSPYIAGNLLQCMHRTSWRSCVNESCLPSSTAERHSPG